MSGTVIRGWGRPATARATGGARGFALLCGVSLAGFCLVAPLAAQTESPDDAARAPAIIAVPGSSAAAGMVDESALRYYASQKQTARMKAEAARLKQLYPGWVEPTDLDTLQPSPPEEAPLWDLFTAGRFDDLDAAIAARRAADPNWRPSDELSRKLLRASFRSRLKALTTARKTADIVTLYRADPSALDPSDVESYWTTAEALASEGGAAGSDEALALYKTVLDTSNDTSVRLATIQKAMSTLPMALAEKLIAIGRTDAKEAPSSRRSPTTSPAPASSRISTALRPRSRARQTWPRSRPMPAPPAMRVRPDCSAGTPITTASSARPSTGSSSPSAAAAMP